MGLPHSELVAGVEACTELRAFFPALEVRAGVAQGANGYRRLQLHLEPQA